MDATLEAKTGRRTGVQVDADVNGFVDPRTPAQVEAEPGQEAFAALERIETGDVDVTEARTLLQRALAKRRDDDAASEVFSSLRSWTGRMLRSSASGDDLRAWHALFKATAAQFRGPLRDWCLRIDVLADLVHERVGMAEARAPADVLDRRHVRRILELVVAAPNGRIDRAQLGRLLGLEQANLTRVCTLMLDAGLIVRREEGRSVYFEPTATGTALARRAGRASNNAVAGAHAGQDVWRVPEAGEIRVAERPSADASAEEWSRHDVPLDNLPLAA